MKDEISSLQGYDSYSISLGDELRGERATKGKSLIDVQKELRIKAAYIAAIEDADLSVFPNLGFVAGYVRSYARYLGLDAERVFQRFCAESGFEGVNAGMQPKSRAAGSVLIAALPMSDDDPLSRSKLGAKTAPKFDFSENIAGLASLAVMGALVLGLGYGGWALLHEVQRVEFAPVAQSPVVGTNVTSGFGSVTVPSEGNPTALEQLYAPRPAATTPQLFEPRDGPIGVIDPDTVGTFAVQATPDSQTFGEQVAIDAEDLGPLLETPEIPSVAIVATAPAWVRVTDASGSALFEKILAPGEEYVLPEGVEGPLLRAGNAGGVFLRLDEITYGPLGVGARVVKDVSLTPEDIDATWQLAEGAVLTDQPATATALAE
ncbi:MAG: RodZ domain-containing protein [Pseudomonadota bacterium]